HGLLNVDRLGRGVEDHARVQVGDRCGQDAPVVTHIDAERVCRTRVGGGVEVHAADGDLPDEVPVDPQADLGAGVGLAGGDGHAVGDARVAQAAAAAAQGARPGDVGVERLAPTPKPLPIAK